MLMELLLGIVGGSSMMDQRRNNDSDSASLDNEDEDNSSSDSSIGAPNDSEEEEEEEGFNNGCTATGSSCSISEGATTMKKGGFGSLGSLASLEDSLPINRKGLSIHMSGKSKSFTNLSEAASSLGSVKDLEKTEHPFNKKRRVLRWSKRNYYKLGQNSPKSMPVLPSIKDEEEEDEDEGGHHHQNQSSPSPSSESCNRGTREAAGGGLSGNNKPILTRQRSIFKSSSYSCFSLADLPEHEEEEEDD